MSLITCSKCKKEVSEDSAFCSFCGIKITLQDMNNGKTELNKGIPVRPIVVHGNRFLLIGITIALLIIMICVWIEEKKIDITTFLIPIIMIAALWSSVWIFKKFPAKNNSLTYMPKKCKKCGNEIEATGFSLEIIGHSKCQRCRTIFRDKIGLIFLLTGFIIGTPILIYEGIKKQAAILATNPPPAIPAPEVKEQSPKYNPKDNKGLIITTITEMHQRVMHKGDDLNYYMGFVYKVDCKDHQIKVLQILPDMVLYCNPYVDFKIIVPRKPGDMYLEGQILKPGYYKLEKQIAYTTTLGTETTALLFIPIENTSDIKDYVLPPKGYFSYEEWTRNTKNK